MRRGSSPQRLYDLETVVYNCCSLMPYRSDENKSAINITPDNSQAAILYQNEPNPFSGKTIIRYFIPETVNNASMVFYNSTGKRMKLMELNQKGEGQVEVDAGSIADGIYSYSLLINGKNVDTKRMVKMK